MFVSSVLAGVLALGAAACSDSVDPASDEVADVLIYALDRIILVGASRDFEGRAATGAAVRVDSLVTWSLSQTGIVTMTTQMTTNESGRRVNIATLTGVKAGFVDLIATAGSVTRRMPIVVNSPGL